MSEQQPNAARVVTGLLLAAVAFLGLAQIAFLPPWEGFDETAHWSYIQQLADTGHSPRYGVDALAADTAAYPGPMPYGAVPPFDRTGRPTYRDYRLAGSAPIAGGPTHYVGADGLNWQAQHPPLYYALLTPVYRAAHGLGWIDHLLILRLASYAMAFAGLAIGVLATVRFAGPIGPWTGPIMAAWPLLFPQFFPEFARLGNDSLCLLLAAVAWAALLRLLDGQGRWAWAVVLGISLGLGLLTKAFFLPIGAGVGLMLALHARRDGFTRAVLGQAALAAAVALAIGGWWYVSRELQTGSLVGSDEFIRLNHDGGVHRLAGAFSPAGLARGLGVIVGTFVWAGTWSLARLPEFLLSPMILLLGLTLWGYARGLTRTDLLGWAPIALAAPLLAGLIYHVLVWMAGVGAATPGWYLHILAAPLGLAVARGWTRPRALWALALLSGLYSAATWAMQLSLFSGCAAKIGADKHYSLAGAGCFIDGHALSAVGHPLAGAVCLVIGLGLAVTAAWRGWRAFRPSELDFLPELQQ
jgi:hypothetical protein